VSFASSLTSHLRRVPGELEPTPGHGRRAIAGHVERWYVAAATTPTDRTALVVVDVDIDDALPAADHEAPGDLEVGAPIATDEWDARTGDDDVPVADEAAEVARRARLGRTVARAISARVRPGDAVARIDAGRFAVLRGVLDDGTTARTEAGDLARCIEDALIGRPEGVGVRVTAGAATLAGDVPRGGPATLSAVTSAMLVGKLLTDDRVVVVVASGG